jgi:hypothetical protein
MAVRGVRVRHGVLVFVREHKWFASTEVLTEQTLVETGGGIQATAVSGNRVQVRSYPTAFGRQHVTAGWEAVAGWDLQGHAPRIASEAVALLNADHCPSEITSTVVLGGDQVALQIHESAGHPAELDRVFGSEAAYAGIFLTLDKLENFRFAPTWSTSRLTACAPWAWAHSDGMTKVFRPSPRRLSKTVCLWAISCRAIRRQNWTGCLTVARELRVGIASRSSA